MIQRRSFLGGLASALAAPAIVPYINLMPVRLVDWASVEYWDELYKLMVDDMRKGCIAAQWERAALVGYRRPAAPSPVGYFGPLFSEDEMNSLNAACLAPTGRA